jgi:hypothetical protein
MVGESAVLALFKARKYRPRQRHGKMVVANANAVWSPMRKTMNGEQSACAHLHSNLMLRGIHTQQQQQQQQQQVECSMLFQSLFMPASQGSLLIKFEIVTRCTVYRGKNDTFTR